MFASLLKSFENKFQNRYPDVFSKSKENAWYEEYFGCLTVGYKVSKKTSIQELKDMFSKDTSLSMLYYAVPSKSSGFGRKLSFYSKPRKDSMIVIWCQSGDQGLVDEIGVNIYASLDDMLVDVQTDLNTIDKNPFEEKEATTHRNLLIDSLL